MTHAKVGAITLTDEQREIVRAAGKGVHLKVAAFAGTGKTSTLKFVADTLSDRKILYLAFNKATAEEAKAKFPDHVEARTAHSLAYRATIKHFGRERITGSVMPLVKEISDDRVIHAVRAKLTGGDGRAAAFMVVRVLQKFVQSADGKVAAKHVPAILTQGIKSKSEKRFAENTLAAAAQGAWDRITETGSTLSITHDFYLKYWALKNPQLPYDVVLFDEAQDANPVMLGLVMGQQRARKIFVGDSHQSIYQFRGAVDAMKHAPGETLHLTKSWRFGENVASWANVVLGMLGERTQLIGGGPVAGEIMDDPGHLASGAVLCRGNAGVVREALDGLERKRKVAVVGGVDEAVKLLYAIYDLFMEVNKPKHPDISLFDTWAELCEFAETDEGSSYKALVKLVDRERGYVPVICAKLRGETVSERDADLVISTAHKAKGREWDDVRLAEDFPALVEVDDDTGAISFNPDEANLLYVAITRAMVRLNLSGMGERLNDEAQLLAEQRRQRKESRGAMQPVESVLF